jgi:iron(III) transport system substrate-binding protein
VSLFKSSSEGLVERIAQESDAGFRGSDVVETNADGLLELDGEDALVAYRSPLLPGLVAGAAQQDWTVDKFNTFTVAWNTDNVSKADEPRSYEDLGDPRWKGKLVVEVDDADWYKTLREYFIAQGEPASRVDAMFERIFRNAVFVNGHSFMTQLVASGEFDVSPDSYVHTIKGLMDKGAPIAWQPAVEPVVVRSDGVAVAKDAAHPAAALLFTDYVLGPGQQVFRDYALDAARKDLSVPPSIDRVTVDVKDFIANEDEWTKRYEQLTKLGTKGPEDTS